MRQPWEVVQAGLEFAMQLGLNLYSWSFCLYFLNCGITGVYHCTWLGMLMLSFIFLLWFCVLLILVNSSYAEWIWCSLFFVFQESGEDFYFCYKYLREFLSKFIWLWSFIWRNIFKSTDSIFTCNVFILFLNFFFS